MFYVFFMKRNTLSIAIRPWHFCWYCFYSFIFYFSYFLCRNKNVGITDWNSFLCAFGMVSWGGCLYWGILWKLFQKRILQEKQRGTSLFWNRLKSCKEAGEGDFNQPSKPSFLNCSKKNQSHVRFVKQGIKNKRGKRIRIIYV